MRSNPAHAKLVELAASWPMFKVSKDSNLIEARGFQGDLENSRYPTLRPRLLPTGSFQIQQPKRTHLRITLASIVKDELKKTHY